jgi:NTE family protein
VKESAFKLRQRYANEARLLASEDPRLERHLTEALEGTLALTPEGAIDVAGPPATTVEQSDAAFLRNFAFEPGSALCLSGAGYRSMLFHAGALLRMNEAALLPRLECVTSVSTSSITAGLLGLKWTQLSFDDAGVAHALEREVVQPLLGLAGTTLDSPVLWFLHRGKLFPRALAKRVFGSATLQDLPDRPRFFLDATNLGSGSAWRFGKASMGDFATGWFDAPRVSLALAVAASGAPPGFAVRLDLRNAGVASEGREDGGSPTSPNEVTLVDGAICDPLAIEHAWSRYQTILVSDAGSDLAAGPKRPKFFLQFLRSTVIVANQVRLLYKRQLVNSYAAGLRDGAYFGIRSHLDDYGLEAPLPYSPELTMRLARLPPLRTALDQHVREQLVNWGYVVCDAALRRHLDHALPPAKDLPYPAAQALLHEG